MTMTLGRRGVFRRMADGLGVEKSSSFPLFAALSLAPIAALVAVGIDLGSAFHMRQALDRTAQSALSAALAQSRALRAGWPDASVPELEARGRGAADIVFNAQAPNVSSLSSTFRLSRAPPGRRYEAEVAYVAEVGTVFLRFVGLTTIPVSGGASTLWRAEDALIDETFVDRAPDLAGRGAGWVAAPEGWRSDARTKAAGAPAIPLALAARYDGPPPPPQVEVAMELDAAPDGNLTIARRFSAEPGLHVLRYWYRDRARSDAAAPAWLCATQEDNTEWMLARDRSGARDTNRMSVYLTAAPAGSAQPAPVALSGATRIDSCYSSGYRWIERVVRLDILAQGDFWLVFRGEGRSDGVGAAVANILLCREPCAAEDGARRPSPASAFPWRRDEVLFHEEFAAASLAASPGPRAEGLRSTPGWIVWPADVARVAPGAPGHVELDVPKDDGGFENRIMGRPFFLAPGFYRLRYVYSAGPGSPNRSIACNYFGVRPALARLARLEGADSERVIAFLDPDRPFLHPEAAGGDGAAPLWYTAGRTAAKDVARPPPRLPDPANAIDFCVGGPPGLAVPREIPFKIERPGYYWLTFAADGPADGRGGRIGPVQIIAVGDTFSGAGIPRIVRTSARGDFTAWPVSAWMTMPPSADASRALYRVQVQ